MLVTRHAAGSWIKITSDNPLRSTETHTSLESVAAVGRGYILFAFPVLRVSMTIRFTHFGNNVDIICPFFEFAATWREVFNKKQTQIL